MKQATPTAIDPEDEWIYYVTELPSTGVAPLSYHAGSPSLIWLLLVVLIIVAIVVLVRGRL
jgi:hypothetical protein